MARDDLQCLVTGDWGELGRLFRLRAKGLPNAEAAIRNRTRPLLIELKCDPDHMPPSPW